MFSFRLVKNDATDVLCVCSMLVLNEALLQILKLIIKCSLSCHFYLTSCHHHHFIVSINRQKYLQKLNVN